MRLFIIARKHQNHYFDLKHISFSNKPTKINYLKYPEYSTNLLHMLSWIVHMDTSQSQENICKNIIHLFTSFNGDSDTIHKFTGNTANTT